MEQILRYLFLHIHSQLSIAGFHWTLCTKTQLCISYECTRKVNDMICLFCVTVQSKIKTTANEPQRLAITYCQNTTRVCLFRQSFLANNLSSVWFTSSFSLRTITWFSNRRLRLLRTVDKKRSSIFYLQYYPNERFVLSNTMSDYLTPLSLTWRALEWRAIAHTFNSDSMQGFDGTSTKSFSFGRINHKRSHSRGHRPNRLFRTTDSKRMRWNCEELEMNSLSNCALTQVHTNVYCNGLNPSSIVWHNSRTVVWCM